MPPNKVFKYGNYQISEHAFNQYNQNIVLCASCIYCINLTIYIPIILMKQRRMTDIH